MLGLGLVSDDEDDENPNEDDLFGPEGFFCF